jgi:hypothetical protein
MKMTPATIAVRAAIEISPHGRVALGDGALQRARSPHGATASVAGGAHRDILTAAREGADLHPIRNACSEGLAC